MKQLLNGISYFNFSPVPALVPNIFYDLINLPTNRSTLGHSPSIYFQSTPLAFPAQQHPTAPYPHFTQWDSWTSWVLLVWASACGDFGFGNAVIV